MKATTADVILFLICGLILLAVGVAAVHVDNIKTREMNHRIEEFTQDIHMQQLVSDEDRERRYKVLKEQQQLIYQNQQKIMDKLGIK